MAHSKLFYVKQIKEAGGRACSATTVAVGTFYFFLLLILYYV